ncbi:hypothetical protein CSAL01_04484 [Colletotrichum salicis]|uniref:Protein kinase domain-containing protein n=1 Tax=Colletotrichum salicis TaxID=1209931 RepID=A0A135RQG1_9PEZI|nr:hypothetical protein CSAL01_04484 [Colletotrichum salicis]
MSNDEIKHHPILFAILVQMGCGHMIRDFAKFIKDDSLAETLHYDRIIDRLKEAFIGPPEKYKGGFEAVTRDFDNRKWAFCPAMNILQMTEVHIEENHILPVFSSKAINEKGGTANVWHFKIQDDLVGDFGLKAALKRSETPDPEFGNYYEFAVKTFGPEYNDIYKIESEAFRGFNSTLDPEALGVVKYLGEYTCYSKKTNSQTHNIMLEFGEFDLDEYLAAKYPPVLNGEIIAFWKSIFQVAKTLQRIHQLKHEGADGNVQTFSGWHGDIKPDNILRVGNVFKLADFGFTKFKKNENSGPDAAHMLGGTLAYGSPERDKAYREKKPTLHLQAIDTWSFGCVLSAVATWVILGSQSYENYNTLREYAIQELHNRQSPECRAPACNDAFHDGFKVLPEVLEWHTHLRNSSRRADTISCAVLDLVEKYMLVEDPRERLWSTERCDELEKIVCEAEDTYQKEIQCGALKEESEETLKALLKFDKDAPSSAESLSQSSFDDNKAVDSSSCSIIPALPKRISRAAQSHRVRKSERVDKILRGKTTNREEVIKTGLSFPKLAESETSGSSSGRANAVEPSVLRNLKRGSIRPGEQPGQPDARSTISGNTPDDQKDDGMQPKAVESVDLPRSKSLREDWEDRRRRSSVTSAKDGRMSPTLPTIPQVVEPEEAASQHAGDHRSSTQPKLMPLGRKHTTQTEIPSSRWLSGSKSYLSPDTTTTLPITRKDSRGHGDDSKLPAILPPSFRREETAIVQEYDKRYKSWSESWGPWGRLSTRVKKTNISLRSDKNVLRAKGKKMLTRFEHSLRSVGKTIDDRNKTDMAMTLSQTFDNYKDYRKKQTLIVLTDGLWEGSNLSNDVETKITKFVGELRNHLGKHEPRWFSIQFVSFGDNKEALQRLKRLDDELGTVEDVVDTKPWTTDKVEQLILGSISQAEDAAQASSSRLQPMGSSPTPSRSSSLSQPKSPLKERNKIGTHTALTSNFGLAPKFSNDYCHGYIATYVLKEWDESKVLPDTAENQKVEGASYKSLTESAMSAREDVGGTELEGPPIADSAAGRACEFPGTKDNASASRADTDLNLYAGSAELDDNTRAIDKELETSSSNSEDDDDDESSTVVDTLRLAKSSAEDLSQAGVLVRDSYGRPRFVGGTANNLIVEAAKSLLPNLITTTPSYTGASHETPNLSDLEVPSFVRGKLWPPLPYIPRSESLPRPPQYVSDLLVSLYFDKLHYTFPILIKPHFMNHYQKLLRSGTDSSSPKRGSFLMVFFAVCACASGLLPSNLESGLPGIEFYQKALLILSASTGESSIEKVQCLGLLSMCSAGWNTLSQSWNLAGQAVRGAIDMGLHVSGHSVTVGNGSSTAGLSCKELAFQEHSRRVWWCVYTLDRITSICLGRPLAVQDEDCHCELPSDVRDEDIVSGIKSQGAIDEEATMSPMSGFLAFARLCRLAGKIQEFSSPLKLRKIASANADKTHRFLARVDAHDQALRKWLESLPGEIQFSANRNNKKHGDISMVHCVITFFLHAGSLINLYRYFLNYPRESAVRNEVDVSGAIDQCVNAAQGCIYVADMVRDLVPSSHHLAICVHYLTLSGIILLRVPLDRSNTALLEDAEKCAQSLKDLEPRWSGAKSSREIIEQLLSRRRSEIAGDSPAYRDNEGRLSPENARKANKRPFADLQLHHPLW